MRTGLGEQKKRKVWNKGEERVGDVGRKTRGKEGKKGRERRAALKERKQEKGGRGNEAQGRNKLTTAIQPKRWIQAGMTGQCADQPITYEPPPDQVFVLFVCRVNVSEG